MRICLVAHGFPPHECTGVEGYTYALAKTLTAAGHGVEVFAPRPHAQLPNLSMRREERDGFGITWITTNEGPANPKEMLDQPGVAIRFGDHLERERPELVHFQHLIKLGIGLLEETKSRGIPAVYTAHDYYSICHRVTLIRPDMQRCTTLGDAKACSRCDLALAFLNQQEGLGDYQLGVFESQLSKEQWSELTAILEGTPETAGYTSEDQAALLQMRERLEARRTEAYSKFDLILSPTEFLRQRMIEGGQAADRIRLLTYGAETRDLADLPRPEHSPGKPLRFGYLGGLAKQKGVHVLLQAFADLKDNATLSIWGASSDKCYVEELEQQAESVGANWMGPFERPELRAVLAQVDVVVVPSIWVENFPFVIREAFAAGRPVITSDVGALPESVRHGRDGLLFAPGDASALAQAMQRFLKEPELLQELIAGIGPIKSIEEQVAELLPIYQELIDKRTEVPTSSLPESLRSWDLRYQTLQKLPQRELFRTVLKGLTRMRRTLLGSGEQRAEVPIPSDALANYSKAQMLLRDLKRERVWLKSSVEDHQETDRALRKEVSWRAQEMDSTKQENQWLSQTVAQREEETQWLNQTLRDNATEMAWLRETIKSKDQELEWIHKTVIGKEEEADWLRQMIIDHQKESEGIQKESEEQQKEHQETRAELNAQNRHFVAALNRLKKERELLGIISQRLDETTMRLDETTMHLDEMTMHLKRVAENAQHHIFIKHTKLGKELIQWNQSLEDPQPKVND